MIGKAVVAGTAVAGAAIAGLVSQSVEAYGEFEQLEGGLEALFGKGSKEMQGILKTSENAYKTLTMSQNQYLKAFEGSYSIINNGISKNASAIEYTNKMISMSTDLYNTYGGTVETYQSAINWALKGTYSYLDNLNVGIKGTKEGFIEAANKSGILNKNIKDTSELTNDQILDVISHYVEAAGALGRTQKEASDTIQGSMNMMKSSWENLVAGFSKDGANLKKLTSQFIKSAGTAIKNLIPVIERAIYGVIEVLPGLLNEIMNRLPAFMTKLMNGLVKVLPILIQMTIKLMVDVFNALAKALPKLLPAVIRALIDALMSLIENADKLIDCGIAMLYGIIDGLISAIPVLQEKAPIIIIKLAGAILRALPKLLALFVSLPAKMWSSIIKNIPVLIRNVPKIIKKMISAMKGEFSKIKDVGKNIIKGLWNGMKDMKDWVIDKVKGLGKGILKGMKKALGIKSPSKEFAIIGRFSMLGYQEGLEKMKPELDKAINGMFNLSPTMTGTMNNTMSPNVNVVNNVNVETDPLGQVVSKIKTFSGGAKNDYNYGYGG